MFGPRDRFSLSCFFSIYFVVAESGGRGVLPEAAGAADVPRCVSQLVLVDESLNILAESSRLRNINACLFGMLTESLTILKSDGADSTRDFANGRLANAQVILESPAA